LHGLRTLLLQDDPAAAEFLQHNAMALEGFLGPAFKAVDVHIRNFDFEQALDTIASVFPEPPPSPDSALAH
jgi:two-component system, sensor histidine kinase and response regulator